MADQLTPAEAALAADAEAIRLKKAAGIDVTRDVAALRAKAESLDATAAAARSGDRRTPAQLPPPAAPPPAARPTLTPPRPAAADQREPGRVDRATGPMYGNSPLPPPKETVGPGVLSTERMAAGERAGAVSKLPPEVAAPDAFPAVRSNKPSDFASAAYLAFAPKTVAPAMGTSLGEAAGQVLARGPTSVLRDLNEAAKASSSPVEFSERAERVFTGADNGLRTEAPAWTAMRALGAVGNGLGEAVLGGVPTVPEAPGEGMLGEAARMYRNWTAAPALVAGEAVRAGREAVSKGFADVEQVTPEFLQRAADAGWRPLNPTSATLAAAAGVAGLRHLPGAVQAAAERVAAGSDTGKTLGEIALDVTPQERGLSWAADLGQEPGSSGAALANALNKVYEGSGWADDMVAATKKAGGGEAEQTAMWALGGMAELAFQPEDVVGAAVAGVPRLASAGSKLAAETGRAGAAGALSAVLRNGDDLVKATSAEVRAAVANGDLAFLQGLGPDLMADVRAHMSQDGYELVDVLEGMRAGRSQRAVPAPGAPPGAPPPPPPTAPSGAPAAPAAPVPGQRPIDMRAAEMAARQQARRDAAAALQVQEPPLDPDVYGRARDVIQTKGAITPEKLAPLAGITKRDAGRAISQALADGTLDMENGRVVVPALRPQAAPAVPQIAVPSLSEETYKQVADLVRSKGTTSVEKLRIGTGATTAQVRAALQRMNAEGLIEVGENGRLLVKDYVPPTAAPLPAPTPAAPRLQDDVYNRLVAEVRRTGNASPDKLMLTGPSRAVVMDALKRMNAEGVIEVGEGGRVVVRDFVPTPKPVAEVVPAAPKLSEDAYRRVVQHVQRTGSASMQPIVVAAGVSPSVATEALKRMAAEGLIEYGEGARPVVKGFTPTPKVVEEVVPAAPKLPDDVYDRVLAEARRTGSSSIDTLVMATGATPVQARAALQRMVAEGELQIGEGGRRTVTGYVRPETPPEVAQAVKAATPDVSAVMDKARKLVEDKGIANVEKLADRLGISKREARVVVNNLVDEGVIEIVEGKYVVRKSQERAAARAEELASEAAKKADARKAELKASKQARETEAAAKRALTDARSEISKGKTRLAAADDVIGRLNAKLDNLTKQKIKAERAGSLDAVTRMASDIEEVNTKLREVAALRADAVDQIARNTALVPQLEELANAAKLDVRPDLELLEKARQLADQPRTTLRKPKAASVKPKAVEAAAEAAPAPRDPAPGGGVDDAVPSPSAVAEPAAEAAPQIVPTAPTRSAREMFDALRAAMDSTKRAAPRFDWAAEWAAHQRALPAGSSGSGPSARNPGIVGKAEVVDRYGLMEEFGLQTPTDVFNALATNRDLRKKVSILMDMDDPLKSTAYRLVTTDAGVQSGLTLQEAVRRMYERGQKVAASVNDLIDHDGIRHIGRWQTAEGGPLAADRGSLVSIVNSATADESELLKQLAFEAGAKMAEDPKGKYRMVNKFLTADAEKAVSSGLTLPQVLGAPSKRGARRGQVAIPSLPTITPRGAGAGPAAAVKLTPQAESLVSAVERAMRGRFMRLTGDGTMIHLGGQTWVPRSIGVKIIGDAKKSARAFGVEVGAPTVDLSKANSWLVSEGVAPVTRTADLRAAEARVLQRRASQYRQAVQGWDEAHGLGNWMRRALQGGTSGSIVGSAASTIFGAGASRGWNFSDWLASRSLPESLKVALGRPDGPLVALRNSTTDLVREVNEAVRAGKTTSEVLADAVRGWDVVNPAARRAASDAAEHLDRNPGDLVGALQVVDRNVSLDSLPASHPLRDPNMATEAYLRWGLDQLARESDEQTRMLTMWAARALAPDAKITASSLDAALAAYTARGGAQPADVVRAVWEDVQQAGLDSPQLKLLLDVLGAKPTAAPVDAARSFLLSAREHKLKREVFAELLNIGAAVPATADTVNAFERLARGDMTPSALDAMSYDAFLSAVSVHRRLGGPAGTRVVHATASSANDLDGLGVVTYSAISDIIEEAVRDGFPLDFGRDWKRKLASGFGWLIDIPKVAMLVGPGSTRALAYAASIVIGNALTLTMTRGVGPAARIVATGLTPDSIALATRLAATEPWAKPRQLFESVGPRGYTMAEVEEGARRLGLTRAEFPLEESSVNAALGAGLLDRMKAGAKWLNPTRMAMTVSGTFGLHGRVAVYLDEIKRGASLEQAAASARDAFYSLDGMTPLERTVMRHLFMFYAYQRADAMNFAWTLVNRPERVLSSMRALGLLARSQASSREALEAEPQLGRLALASRSYKNGVPRADGTVDPNFMQESLTTGMVGTAGMFLDLLGEYSKSGSMARAASTVALNQIAPAPKVAGAMALGVAADKLGLGSRALDVRSAAASVPPELMQWAPTRALMEEFFSVGPVPLKEGEDATNSMYEVGLGRVKYRAGAAWEDGDPRQRAAVENWYYARTFILDPVASELGRWLRVSGAAQRDVSTPMSTAADVGGFSYRLEKTPEAIRSDQREQEIKRLQQAHPK